VATQAARHEAINDAPASAPYRDAEAMHVNRDRSARCGAGNPLLRLDCIIRSAAGSLLAGRIRSSPHGAAGKAAPPQCGMYITSFCVLIASPRRTLISPSSSLTRARAHQSIYRRRRH